MASIGDLVKCIECETASELMEKLRSIFADKRNSLRRPGWLFRGHADDAWELMPSALRLDPNELEQVLGTLSKKGVNTSEEQIWSEASIMLQFIETADSIGLAIPDDSMTFREHINSLPKVLMSQNDSQPWNLWIPRLFFAALAMVRHAGLPTRLLDWTSNPSKAAYFAAAEVLMPKKNYKAKSDLLSVWAIDRSRLTRDPVIGSWLDNTHQIFVEFFCVPNASNLRAYAQEGWFSTVRKHHDVNEQVERIPLDQEISRALKNPVGEPVFWRFRLPRSQGRNLLSFLAREGMSAATVFPDYNGVAESVRENFWLDRGR